MWTDGSLLEHLTNRFYSINEICNPKKNLIILVTIVDSKQAEIKSHLLYHL